MDLETYEKFLNSLFDQATLVPGEYGFTCRADNVIRRIGYATNLTPEVVSSAIDHGVDLIITHHDAWDFIYGMKDECVAMLTKNKVSHYFAHLPLDAADFGTAAAFGRRLGGRMEDKTAMYEGFLCGRIWKLPTPVDLVDFIAVVQDVCHEDVEHWRNSDKPVSRFAIVPGGGVLTSYVKDCVDHDCDLYVTGEKSLYTVMYAKYAGIHLIVGSHTFTEIFGVEALVNLISAEYPELSTVRIEEPHLEKPPNKSTQRTHSRR